MILSDDEIVEFHFDFFPCKIPQIRQSHPELVEKDLMISLLENQI